MQGCSKPPILRIRKIELFERPVNMRLPFRFGRAVVNEAPQLFARIDVEDENGRTAQGLSAELLVPKWFDKNPSRSHADNFEELRNSVRLAAAHYLATEPASAFEIFLNNYEAQRRKGAQNAMTPLTASFGQAFLDRAVVDALCRLGQFTFHDAIRQNLIGLHCRHETLQDLDGFDLEGFLACIPEMEKIHVRHTVGFLDPLEDADKNTDLDDGLPVTLQDCIVRYGYRFYKVLVTGVMDADMARLRAVSAVLDREAGDYVASLDGSEQFTGLDQITAFLERVRDDAGTRNFFARLAYIEQPIHRDRAATIDLGSASDILPVVLDEGDTSLDAFPKAWKLGYRGVSSKSCKGLYKSLLNAARCQRRGENRAFMTGEDLTMQPGIAMQQDLALAAALGLDNVQRNGHHYVRGIANAGRREQQGFLQAHPDLYETVQDRVCLKIRDGQVQIASLDCPGFAVGAEPDWDSMAPVGLSVSAPRQPDSGPVAFTAQIQDTSNSTGIPQTNKVVG